MVMMKKTQRNSNPYPYSDTNKRYQTYEYYMRRKFGGRVAKIPLDAGLSCPNIDAGAGCIYCSGRGSGDTVPMGLSLRAQYDEGRAKLSSKWSTEKCIAYLQAHTNTYAPVDVLRGVYEEILTFPNLCGISIATRADCLPEDVCLLLREMSERIPLTVELGLQSSSDVTAKRICRGHTMADFEEGYARLRRLVPKAEVCVHIIFGLPDESDEDMLNTVKKVAELEPEQVKIHLLHVIKDTPLGDEYLRGEYIPLERERYISLVVEALKLLPPETVICRLTGDGIADDLLAPEYSKRKIAILNDIDKLMFASGATQGCNYKKN